MREKREIVELDNKLASRSVNEGFSGGEKKKNEIFQMAMLQPRLSILDETDSGLDIDALRIVAEGVNKLKSDQNATIVITHYQRLLDYIAPDFVHVLYKGRIVNQAVLNWPWSWKKKDMIGSKKKSINKSDLLIRRFIIIVHHEYRKTIYRIVRPVPFTHRQSCFSHT